MFTFLFQGVLDEAEKIELAPIENTDLNQGNLPYLLHQKCIANLFFFRKLVAILCLFDNSFSVTVVEIHKPSKVY